MIEILSSLGLMASAIALGFFLIPYGQSGPKTPVPDEITVLTIPACGLICGWRGSIDFLNSMGLNPHWGDYSPLLFVFGCALGLWRPVADLLNERPARGETHSQPASARQEAE